MADDFGAYQGLAVKSNLSDQIGDYERHDLRMQQNKSLAESKAKIFADSVAYQNSANAFDYAIIKEYNTKIINEIGTYMKENPDALYNKDKILFIQDKRRELNDNIHVLRAKASDDNKKKLDAQLEDMKKNPNLYDQEAYQDLLNQWNNYSQYGNQLGLEASQKEGLKPFAFITPQPFEPDLAKTIQAIGKNIGEYDIKKNEDGDYWRVPNKEAVTAYKNEILPRYKRQLEVEGKKSGITNPQAIDAWVEKQLVGGFPKEYHVGDPDAKFKKQMAWAELNERKRHNSAMEAPKGGGGANFSAWDESFRNPNKPAGMADPAGIKAIVGDTPKIVVYNESDGQAIDLTGKDFFPDNRYITSEGQKFLTGFLKLSKDEAKKAGIYKKGALTIDGITNGFAKQASEEKGTNKDGSSYDYIKLKYQLPFNVNDKTLRARYDNTIQPDKTVDLQSSFNQSKPVYNTSMASLKKAGYSDAQIQQGINQGVFIIK